MERKGSGWLVAIIIICLLGLLGSCMPDSEYETAGKTFGTWIKTDPRKWTDTQTDYFNNFMDWADKH